MPTMLLIIFVVAGFIFMLAARWPIGPAPYSERVAWVCWTVASLLWAWGQVGAR